MLNQSRNLYFAFGGKIRIECAEHFMRLVTRGEGIASTISGVMRLSSTIFLGIGIFSPSLMNLALFKYSELKVKYLLKYKKEDKF